MAIPTKREAIPGTSPSIKPVDKNLSSDAKLADKSSLAPSEASLEIAKEFSSLDKTAPISEPTLKREGLPLEGQAVLSSQRVIDPTQQPTPTPTTPTPTQAPKRNLVNPSDYGTPEEIDYWKSKGIGIVPQDHEVGVLTQTQADEKGRKIHGELSRRPLTRQENSEKFYTPTLASSPLQPPQDRVVSQMIPQEKTTREIIQENDASIDKRMFKDPRILETMPDISERFSSLTPAQQAILKTEYQRLKKQDTPTTQASSRDAQTTQASSRDAQTTQASSRDAQNAQTRPPVATTRRPIPERNPSSQPVVGSASEAARRNSQAQYLAVMDPSNVAYATVRKEGVAAYKDALKLANETLKAARRTRDKVQIAKAKSPLNALKSLSGRTSWMKKYLVDTGVISGQ